MAKIKKYESSKDLKKSVVAFLKDKAPKGSIKIAVQKRSWNSVKVEIIGANVNRKNLQNLLDKEYEINNSDAMVDYFDVRQSIDVAISWEYEKELIKIGEDYKNNNKIDLEYDYKMNDDLNILLIDGELLVRSKSQEKIIERANYNEYNLNLILGKILNNNI